MKLLEFRAMANGKPLKAFLDVELENGIVVRDLRVIQEAGKRAWIACPQSSWKDPVTGQIKYRTIITFPDAIKGEIDLLVLNAWAREKEKDRGGPAL